MSYTITKSDGSTLPTIPDGTLDTSSTNLALPGPNFVGYGQYLNQNLVHLLENFSSNTVPSGTNVQGQLWFDKFHQRLNVYTTNGFVPVAGITNSGTRPVITNDGEFWFDTYNNQFYVSNSSTWNLIGPQYTKAQGVSGAIPVAINDAATAGVFHNVLQLQFGSSIIATFSTDAQFVPKNYDPGFPVIYSGLTINANVSATQQLIGTATINSGNITGISTLTPAGNTITNLGSTNNRWNTIYGVSTSAVHADLAEKYRADANYESGTVLMFGGAAEVTAADPATTAIAGVVSTNPAYLMNSELDSDHTVALALVGRVPCRVMGPVVKGDLLISAGQGLAQSATNTQPGQIVGRALETVTEHAAKTIEIVVGRIG